MSRLLTSFFPKLSSSTPTSSGSATTTTTSTTSTTTTTTTTSTTTTSTTFTTTSAAPPPNPAQKHKARIDHFFASAPPSFASSPAPSSPFPLSVPPSSPLNCNPTTSTASTTSTSPSASSPLLRPLCSYSRNPFYSLTTLNITSLCCYSSSHDGRARRRRIKKTLLSLSKYDFILLQETKLLAHDSSALHYILHTHKIYYNNNPNNLTGVPPSAGTLIAVKHSILTNYDITNHIVLPGHCQTLHLTPLKPDWPSITVTNLRLYTGPDKTTTQNTQIHSISSSLLTLPANLRYLAGDLNFTSLPDDSTNAHPDEPDSWPLLLSNLALTEICQPDHTYFSSSPSTSKFLSSKIDKIFIAFPEPEWLLATPKAHTTDSILNDIKDYKHSLLPSNTTATDSTNTHIPVFLSFHKQVSNSKCNKRTTFHKNVFEDPNFPSHFKNLYEHIPNNPVADLAHLKDAITKAYTLTLTKDHAPRRLYQFTICAKALREHDKPNPSFNYIYNLTKHNNFLTNLIYWNDTHWVDKKLRAAIEFMLADGIPDPVSNVPTEGLGPKPLNPGTNTNSIVEALRNIKLSLPSTKKRVTALRESAADTPTSDPSKLGSIVSAHYGKLWSGPTTDSATRSRMIDAYLDDYICPENARSLPKLALEHVKEAILSSGNSAPGPDGLPFIAFRRTVDVSAFTLYNYAQHLPDLPSDISTFNRSTLLLLPKNDSCLVNDTRPLCINNTDNRLIAFALVILILPIADSLLDAAQQGFIKGRLMTKHLRDLNAEFYAKWSSDEEFFVLLTDNAKAFDSIHHDFIFKTLSAQGFPTWFVSTVRSLLSSAVTCPTLNPSTSIPICRGVKQGCPLSPILFVLIYDPLIRALKSFPDIDLCPRAAADDLAASSSSLPALFGTAMPAIDRFCAASGMGINKDKTVILTSLPLDDPKSLEPSPRIMPVIDLTRHTAPTSPLPALAPARKARRSRGPRLTQRKKSVADLEAEVEAIISKRWNPHQHPNNNHNHKNSIYGYWEYEVLWKGFGLDHTTWEPIENLSRCRESVAVFNASWVQPPSYAQDLAARMVDCPWKDIKFVNATKYLGIIFSNSKDAYATKEANFQPILTAARKRLSSFRSAIKRSSLLYRILIINVFITSLFSYKIDFMTVPTFIYNQYRSLIAKSIISYGGTAFIYEHLTVPTTFMGLKTHINDLWVQYMMRHLRRAKLTSLKDPGDLPWALNTKDDKHGIYYHSPIFEENTSMALMEFLGKDILNWDGTSDLSKLKDKHIKRTLLQCGLHTGPPNAIQASTPRALKLNQIFLNYNTTPTNTLNHFSSLDPNTPNQLLTHHLKLYTYAIETDKRIRFFNPNATVHPAACASNPFPCYLCPNGTDTILHIYDPTACPAVHALISDLAITHDAHHQALIDPAFVSELICGHYPLFIMEFPMSSSKNLDKCSFVLALNFAIWQLRKLVRAGGVPGAFHKFTLRQSILKFKPFWSNPKGNKPSGTKYGSASSRSAAQKALALADAQAFVSSIPSGAAIVYTDGSSLGNPGPAGAGALVVSPSCPGPAVFHRLHCPLCTLGEARSNNFAELWAIGMAISFLLDAWPARSRPTVYFLSDSKFITDLLNRTSFSVEFEGLVTQVLTLKDAYSAHHLAILFCWVPGHAGLAGNEAADAMANEGSGTARTLPLHIPSRRNERFEYHISPDVSPP